MPRASGCRVAASQPARLAIPPCSRLQPVARADPSTLKALSAPLATTPPVDADRVSKIKKAIADGKFPLVPSTVADRLLALKLEWKPNEQT